LNLCGWFSKVAAYVKADGIFIITTKAHCSNDMLNLARNCNFNYRENFPISFPGKFRKSYFFNFLHFNEESMKERNPFKCIWRQIKNLTIRFVSASLRILIEIFQFSFSIYWQHKMITHIHRDPWLWLLTQYVECPHFRRLLLHKVPYRNTAGYRSCQRCQYEWIWWLKERNKKISFFF
jgi:hypothetical protein